MRRFSLAVTIYALLSIMPLVVMAETTAGLKLNPYAVDYPLTRSVPYITASGDVYEASFGIRRWLRPLKMSHDVMHDQTLSETQKWFSSYGGYGVLGRGEDVFTQQGERLRRKHRGH